MEFLNQLSEIRASLPIETVYKAFGILVCFDVITGITKAWKNSNLKSKTLRNGLFCSFGELIVLALCILATALLPIDVVSITVFMLLVFMVLKELFSICENLIEIGVKLPKFLINGLKVYSDIIDNGGKEV